MASPATVYSVTVRVVPSTSLSLVRTLPEDVTSSAKLAASFVARGASFTGVTVMFSWAVDVRIVPSTSV